MTTIRDIARESGVSVSTVSRVLAGHPDVSPSTAAVVHAAIERHHFHVNRNASNLKRGNTTSILVIVKGRYNMLFAAMMEHVQAAVTATGHTVIAQYMDEDANEVAEAERWVGEIKPCGVIFLGADAGHMEQSHLLGEKCPAVVLTNSLDALARPGISCVTTNDRAAAASAIEYLLDSGHRRIGVIGGQPAQSAMSAHRQRGVIEAMTSHGVEFDLAKNYIATRFSLESGYLAAQRLLESAPHITAVYAMGDIMALGAIRGFYERGLRVPDDISLIGHDGIEPASYVVPKLTTVRQPREALVTRGVEILMRHIGGDPTPVAEIMDVEIVSGESVRRLAE
ncbi:MAG: LacI family transcriptional regulator [Propionibacteriaceae bacterium]|nr:LacI family transcriptional regulator [Propionibacteriaceae bacterium]